jgi:hypothetical protein
MINRSRYWKRLVFAGFLVALIGVPAALRSFRQPPMPLVPHLGPPPQLYTSPPVMAYGKKVRYRMRIPAGWEVHVPGRMFDFSPVFAGASRYTYLPLSAVPPGDTSAGHERGALQVGTDGKNFYPNRSGPPNQVQRNLVAKQFHGYARILQGGRFYCIEYRTNDGQSFDATYRQICESFKVIQ